MQRSWRRARAMLQSWDDVALAGTITGLATMLPLLVRVLPLPRTLALLTPGGTRVMPPDITAYGARAAALTDAVLRRNLLWYRRNCLKRALILFAILRRRGVPVELRMGVRPTRGTGINEPDTLEGHAWLELDNQPFLEPKPRVICSYRVTYRYPCKPVAETALKAGTPPAMSAERALLLACGRVALGWDRPGVLTTLFNAELDAARFLDLARAHGMSIVTHRILSGLPAEKAPAFMATLQQQRREGAAQSLLLTAELIAIARALDGAGIPYLVFKGPVLAATLHGSVVGRRFSDIDVLVDETDRERVAHLLQSRGYHSRLKLRWEQSFVHSDNPAMVDVHWAWADPRRCHFPLSLREACRRACKVDLAGYGVRSPGAEDTVLIHCINAAKDGWVSLGAVWELGALLRMLTPSHWETLLVRARQLRVERLLLLGTVLAHELFALPMPAPAQPRLARHPSVPKLVPALRRRLLGGVKSEPNGVAAEWRALRAREGLAAKLPHLRRITRFFVTPNERDYAIWALPAHLRFLHYGLRPLRLVAKHLARVARGS